MTCLFPKKLLLSIFRPSARDDLSQASRERSSIVGNGSHNDSTIHDDAPRTGRLGSSSVSCATSATRSFAPTEHSSVYGTSDSDSFLSADYHETPSGTLHQNREPPTSATCKYDEAGYAQLHSRRSLGFDPAKHEEGYYKFLDQLGGDGAMRIAGPEHQAEIVEYFSLEETKGSRWSTTGNDRISIESRGPDRRRRSIMNGDTQDWAEHHHGRRRQVGKSSESKGRRVLSEARNLMSFDAWGRKGSSTPPRK